jgi:hypothetical protein
MAQSVGHESLVVVLTGIGPVFAFALLSVRCTCMVCLYFIRMRIASHSGQRGRYTLESGNNKFGQMIQFERARLKHERIATLVCASAAH